MDRVRCCGPARATESMGRRCLTMGQRSLEAPGRRRKGCALCRDSSGVEKRTTWAAAFCLGARIFRLENDAHAVTLTVRCGKLRQGTSHFPQSLGTNEVESSRMSIQVICPSLAGNGPAPCSNTTIKKLHEFFDHAGSKPIPSRRLPTGPRRGPARARPENIGYTADGP